MIDSEGCAWIDDSNVKVLEVVRDHIAYGWSPEEIHWQHPHPGLAPIYAALAYCHDHRPAMDAKIQDSLVAADPAARLAADSPIARRLRSVSLPRASPFAWMCMFPVPSPVPTKYY